MVRREVVGRDLVVRLRCVAQRGLLVRRDRAERLVVLVVVGRRGWAFSGVFHRCLELPGSAAFTPGQPRSGGVGTADAATSMGRPGRTATPGAGTCGPGT